MGEWDLDSMGYMSRAVCRAGDSVKKWVHALLTVDGAWYGSEGAEGGLDE